VTDELLLISNSTEASDWLPGARLVADTRIERGSLVGLHTALSHAPHGVLVVAWDMPFVTVELLRVIVDRSAGAEYATVPHGVTGPEPFCAAYTEACLPFIEAALDANDFRLSSFLARLPEVEHVRLDEVARIGDPARLFFNVNSAADLATAEGML
jgi:molybdopterin-guanine dinucleotide biosynthesis protein A